MKTLLLSASLICLACYTQAQQTVKFVLKEVPTLTDGYFGLRGSVAPLDWQQSVPLWEEDGELVTVIQFNDSVEEVAFKFVFQSNEEVRWEGIENRELVLSAASDTLVTEHQWDIEQEIDISKLAKIAPDQLSEDFLLIEQMMREVHPGTYRYMSEMDVRDVLAQLEETFKDSLTYGEAYLAISKSLAAIQCDHTYASFYNQNKYLKSVIHRQKDKLPFAFRWINERMIVTRSAISTLKRGQEVTSINGVPVRKIANALLPFVSADGGTDHNRWAKLEVNSYDFRFSDFDVFYPLVFPVVQAQLEMQVFDFTTERSTTISSTFLTAEERWASLSDQEGFPKKRDDLLHFKIVDEVGMLSLGSFVPFGWKRLEIDFEDFLQKVFSELSVQGVEHLIIDIRQNIGGGDQMLDQLFTYLDIDRIIIDDRVGKTRYREFPEALKPYCQTWGHPWFYSLEPEKEEGAYFIFAEGAQENRENEKKPLYFQGDLYWLTSPHNVSLAYYTAKAARTYGLGELIGEETGGNLRGINGGQILFMRLPGTGIEIDFPVMGDFSIGERPNSGVVPDHQVVSQVQDIANEYDRQLAYTMDLIAERKE